MKINNFQEISIADYKNRKINKFEKKFVENPNAVRGIRSKYEKKIEINVNRKIAFTEMR